MKPARSRLQTLSANATHAVRTITSYRHRLSRTHRKVIIAGVCLIMITGGWFILNHSPTTPNDRAATSSPDFQTVLPARTSIDELGGWQRVSPRDAAPTYAYVDQIDNVNISVSQQLLPANFMENTEQRVKDLAEDFSATTELSLEGGDKLYIGTSARGPQSAIIIKNGLLILIKSEEKISDAAWKQYAASLE